MDIELTNLDDKALGVLRVRILEEQERRTNLTRIPDRVADLCRTYREGGGDPAFLERAVNTE